MAGFGFSMIYKVTLAATLMRKPKTLIPALEPLTSKSLTV